MEIRPYTAADREGCLAALETVAPESLAAFEAYLDAAPVLFVAEHDGRIAGFGGIETGDGMARLVWGTVRRDVQRMGLGRFLLMYRLKEISKRGNFEFVTAQVPEAAQAFFLAQGFRQNGPLMTKRLAVCA
jgi:ribosomal protein S18 acetylase RimI-like enzyme